ncbi:MAG: carbohydrate kinase family protein [Patescibacteria group bacterium]
MPHIFDAITIGSAKIDAFLSVHEANDCFRLNKETNELCVRSGQKIEVDRCNFLLGGNAANVGVGLSRLGLKSAIYAEIGDDELSQKILKALKKENVNTQFLIQTKGGEASFSIIINFKGERTIFSEHVDRLHNFNFDNISTKSVYLTSLGHEWKKPYKKVFSFVKKTKCFLAFNPGTLQIEAGYKTIADVLSITDILFVNKEEAAQIVNYELRIMNQGQNKEEIKRLLEMLQKLGPKIAVITDGENGSYAIDEKGEMFTQDAIKTKVIEKTGAGDSYSTGFLSAILHELSIKEAMRWGALNAASVIEQVGAQAGLLHKNYMEKN